MLLTVAFLPRLGLTSALLKAEFRHHQDREQLDFNLRFELMAFFRSLFSAVKRE